MHPLQLSVPHLPAPTALSSHLGSFCWAAGGGYLANVQPSEWAARFEQRLPEAISGAAFLEHYGTHWDGATSIDTEQVGCFLKLEQVRCAAS